MKLTDECVPCLLHRVWFEAQLADPDRAMDAVLVAARKLGAASPGEVSAEVATRVHGAAYRALGTDDPYREAKRQANEVALSLLPRARDIVDRSPPEDRLRAAALMSIVGNVMDFGVKGGLLEPELLLDAFDDLAGQGLGRDDTDAMRSLLGPGSRVAYLTDNSGEVVLDRLLISELRDLGCHVTLVVKGDPILSDATRTDVEELGMETMVDEVLDTGELAVGVDLSTVPEATRDAILGADLVVAKGMANYESLSDSEVRPIAYLLRTKCDPVARSIGEAKDINLVKLFQ